MSKQTMWILGGAVVAYVGYGAYRAEKAGATSSASQFLTTTPLWPFALAIGQTLG